MSDEQSHRVVETTAIKLIARFGSPKWRKFYILVAYKLSEAQIWHNVEIAEKKRNPGAYFHWKCQQDIQSRKV